MTPRARAALGLEGALVLVGAALRLRLRATFLPGWGYDAASHWATVAHVRVHGEMPPPSLLRAAYHPPLYYRAAAALAGAGPEAVQALSLACGVASLLLLWLGLRRHVESPVGRAAALALAAVLPCSLHLDGMISNEPLDRLLGAAAILLLAEALRPGRRLGWGLVAALGACLGLALLTKVSALVLVATTAGAAGWLLARPPAGLVAPRRRALGLATAAALGLVIGVPAHARRAGGGIFPTGFDGQAVDAARLRPLLARPYLARRPFRYVAGTGAEIWREPWWPSDGDGPGARFWPVLVASTFADYYHFRFWPPASETDGPDAPDPDGPFFVNGLPLDPGARAWMRRAVQAGAGIALLTLAAFFAAAAALLGRRHAPACVIAAPVLAALGQLHFAVRFPLDAEGVVKGAYLQFAAAPLLALFGVAVGWLARPRAGPLARAAGWAGAAGALGLVAVVGGYTLEAVRWPVSAAVRRRDALLPVPGPPARAP